MKQCVEFKCVNPNCSAPSFSASVAIQGNLCPTCGCSGIGLRFEEVEELPLTATEKRLLALERDAMETAKKMESLQTRMVLLERALRDVKIEEFVEEAKRTIANMDPELANNPVGIIDALRNAENTEKTSVSERCRICGLPFDDWNACTNTYCPSMSED